MIKKIKDKLILFLLRLINTLFYIFENKKNIVVINAYIKQIGPWLKHYNLGDDLNYYIISALTGKRVYNHRWLLNRWTENVMCIGSVLDAHSNKNTVVWGSGAMYGGNYKLKNAPKKVLAVRGPLTREYLLNKGVDCPEVYGDPALLLPYVYNPQCLKKYKVGIIPHFVDLDNRFVKEFILSNPNDVKLINLKIYDDWHKVIDEINECEFVISSSLHGLIISDAYNIPNLWVEFSDKVAGNGFKFRDYFASVGRLEKEPVRIKSTIDFKTLKEKASSWYPIKYDCEALINSCPFKLKELL